ncbi:MAG TPA: deoxyribose-phosphate aldolase [Vicinamibacterales bacterium]|nr:deoxyribose-phosphate aldolase [Vicinamibacterales bacterium]
MSTLTIDLGRLLALVVEEVRRARRSDGAGARTPRDPADLGRVIDHTLLRPDATGDDIDRLCREAVEYGFATVCVNPYWVHRASRRLVGTPVGVCAVVGFPFGAQVTSVKAAEARRALADGAREIDMVVNIGALRSGDYPGVLGDIAAVASPVASAGGCLKVILETAALDDREKVAACVLSRAAGADFVKTSTGFGAGGATVADVELLRRVVGPAMGVKAAGGIRDVEMARVMLAAGATRIGTSAGVAIVQADRSRRV